MSHRTAFAALQRRFPTAFARLCTEDCQPAVSLAADDDLAAVSDLPDRLRIGDTCLACAADPVALVDGAGSIGSGPLTGQVAVVSGAASGLGLGIARGLYAAGACVAFTDIDEAGLAAVAAELDDPARVFTHPINVTDEASVISGFDAIVERFGRLDGVVCAAGIAPPFKLVDFPVDKFRLANEINLTGYFLYAREAARIMTTQGHGGAMVMLSSKSGLDASKANTAYNATKAGEIHMARGWALELGDEGIRVNCIAPGNVFEGSKIWNPDYIKVCAEKKGIKPEEVIPHYVSMTALNREIKPTDIANAAVFLLGEQSRCVTGQVLVVDSGQVFTR